MEPDLESFQEGEFMIPKSALITMLLIASFAVAKEKSFRPVSHAVIMQSVSQQASSQPMTTEQAQGLRDDLTHMKALVQQMETNLSFVDTTQSPLKHQFQLEIDMWKTMIRQMERRLGQGTGK
jgi:hypothetical protein